MKKIIQQTVLCFFLFFIPFLQSCSNSKSNNYSLDDVQIIIDIESAMLASLKFGNIQFIPLETTNDCLIGAPHKVLIKNEKIYVGDFNKAMALFVFDMHGKYIHKISRRGQGPQEYISFRDFDINKNGDIYMFDMFGSKIVIYDSKGEFIKNIKFDYYFNSFCLWDNKIYLSKLWGNGDKSIANLAVYDVLNGKTTILLDDKIFLYDIPISRSHFSFYQSANKIYYSPKFSPIVYSINSDGIKPEIGFSNLLIPPESLVGSWMDEKDFQKKIELITDNNYFLENVYFFETDKYIHFEYKAGRKSKYILYNKYTKSTHEIFTMAYYMSIGNNVSGSTEKYFFTIADFNTGNQFNKQILESREELKNWQEEDNPVIVIFDLDMDSPLPFSKESLPYPLKNDN